MEEAVDEFGIAIKKSANAEVDEFGIPLKKKESTNESPAASTSDSKTVSTPLSENGGEVDFLAQANNLPISEEQKREEQFQQTGNTGQDDLKAKQTKLATKQLEKNNIETEAAKHYKAIEDNSEYPLMQELKTLLAQPPTPETTARIEEIKATPVSDDWRRGGAIQVSESQTIPVQNLKKSAYKTYGEMADATIQADAKFGELKEKADLINAELAPAIQQKRNEAAYIPDGKDEQGNEYLKLNPMQSFVEGFGGSVEAIGLGLKKLNPLYSREELKNDLKVKYLRDNILFPKQADGVVAQGTEMLGGVAPLIAAGAVGAPGYGALAINALTFGTMDLGGGMYEGFAEGKGKGMSDDEAMQFADKIGIEKGLTGTVLGATMPMQSAAGRKIFINKAEAGALKTFLAEQGVMVPAFMSRTLIDNLGAKVVGSERDLAEGVAESGASAFMIGAMTHAIGSGMKLPAKTKDIFENTIAKNYGSLNGVISKAVSDGAIDFATGQRIAEKAKAFETIGKDLEPKLEEKLLTKQIEIDNLEKENENKKGAIAEINEVRVEELNREIKEDLGAPLSEKEQKEYETILAKEEQKPAEGKPKPKLTALEKSKKKHYEKRIATAEKKAEKIEEEQLKSEANERENTSGGDTEGETTSTPPAETTATETVADTKTEPVGDGAEPAQKGVREGFPQSKREYVSFEDWYKNKVEEGVYSTDIDALGDAAIKLLKEKHHKEYPESLRNAESPTPLDESLSKFGWTSEKRANEIGLINRKGKEVATIQQKGSKYIILDKAGNKLLSGNDGIENGAEKVAKEYFYAKEEPKVSQEVKGESKDYEVTTEPTELPDGEPAVKVTITKPDGEKVDVGVMEESEVKAVTDKKIRGFKLSDKSADTADPAKEVSSLEEKIDILNGVKEKARNNPVGKEVTFTHPSRTNPITGVVKSVEKDGRLKITDRGGINYTVKPEKVTFERTAEQIELQGKNDALLNDIRASLTPTKAVEPKKEADKIVKMGVPGTQQLADLPNKIFQNVLAEKVVRPLEDYVAKTVQKASVSTNKAKRTIADFLTSFSRGIVDTQEYSKDKRQFTGDINTAKLEAQDMHKAMWDLIGGDLNAADRVHQVLDPELRGTGLTYADLTANEQQLFDLLRKINDYTHNENFLIDRISQETFDKFKDKYIGREYDYEMSYDPQIGKPLREILGIYKQRGEVDLEKQLHSIKDPIYLTLRRFLQTGQNKAIVEYSDLLHEQYKTGNVNGNEPLVLTKDEANGREGFVELGKGFGKLSHKFVARHIAEDFNGFQFNNAFVQMIYDVNRVYDGLAPRQMMKELLTVGNPQVQLGNFTSNVIFSWMGGVDMPTYLSKLPEAIKQINEKGSVYRELTKEGLLKTDFVSADLKPMQTTLGAPQSKNVLTKGREKLRSLYGGVDDAAKIQMYLSLKDMGYTHEQSVKTIFESLQNYQNTGRVWDFASKTPIVGNAFVKFTPEMLRMLKNGATRRPLHTMALIGMLYSMPKLIGKYFGNDDDEIDAAGRQKGIPKIMIPYTDLSIPLSWRVGDKRINIARYMMPMYQYDIGGENKVATEFANKFIPYKIKTTEEGGVEPSVDDPFVAPIIGIIRNKDFRDKQIAEETDNSFDKTMKRLRYAGRGYGGWYAGMVDDIFSTTLTGEDFYGRRKTATDIALNTIIKIETFDDARLKEGIEREFDGYGRATNSLYSAYTKKRKAFQSDLEQVQADTKMNADRKKELTDRAQRKLQHLASNVLEDIAEIQEKQLEATEFYRNLSRKQPYTDLQKHFKETEKEISQIEDRIDGKFKDKKSSPFAGFTGFKGFKKK